MGYPMYSKNQILALIFTCLSCSSGFGQTTQAYNFTTSGAEQSFVVPDGVYSILIKAWGGGAAGGAGASQARGGGAGGAFTSQTIATAPGTTFKIVVGGGGSAGNNSSSSTGGEDSFLKTAAGVTEVLAKGGAVSNTSSGAMGSTTGCIPLANAIRGGHGAAASGSNGGGGGAGATESTAGASASDVFGGSNSGAAGSGGAGAGGDSGAPGLPGAAPGGGGGGKDNGSHSAGVGASGRVTVTYTPVQPPVVAGIPSRQDYQEGVSGSLLLAAAGVVTDSDSANFGGGRLRVTFSSGLVDDEDRLWVSEINGITLTGSLTSINGVISGLTTVNHGGIPIGTIDVASNGLDGKNLEISLNSQASAARAQDLLRSIHYRNMDAVSAVAGARNLQITLEDGSGSKVTAATSITVINSPFDIRMASTAWTPILRGANYDPSEDQQAKSGPDLIGSATMPMLYGKYDDMGTADSGDDIIAFRARVDDSLTSNGSYSGYVFVGMDFELDGDIDIFFALEGTSKGTKVYVYETSDLCISPNTTGIGASYLIPNHNTLTDASYSPVHTVEGITEAAANSYAGSDSETDYFMSFQFKFADLKSVLDARPLNSYYPSASGYTKIGDLKVNEIKLGMSTITPYRFILATATQNNALNSDFGGIGRMTTTQKSMTWSQLGLFPDGGAATLGNQAPSFVVGSNGSAAYSVPENLLPVATLAGQDPEGDDILFSILTGPGLGADGGLFQIDPFTGALSFVSPPDHEAPADAGRDNECLVTVQISDGKGGLCEQLVHVFVTDLSEGANAVPLITSHDAGAAASLSVSEQTAGVITTVTASDSGDLSGMTVVAARLSFSLEGVDAALFRIDSSTGELSFVTPPDYETRNVYEIVVRVTDSNGAFDLQTLTIHVTDVIEAPVSDTSAILKWGVAGALAADGLLDATVIPNTTTAPVIYSGVNHGQFDVHLSTRRLTGNGTVLVGGEVGWYINADNSSNNEAGQVRVRFFRPGTTTPAALSFIHFSIEDAEQKEELSNFCYYTADGTKVPVAWSNGIFSYSHTPTFGSAATSVENNAPLLGKSQSGKWVRVNLKGMAVSGIEFNYRRRSSLAGSIFLSHLGGNPGNLGFAGNFLPLFLTTGSDARAVVPDYRSQAVWTEGIVGTVTQTPAPGTKVSVGTSAVILTLTTSDERVATLGFDLPVFDGTPPVITAPAGGFSLAELQALPDFARIAQITDNVAVTQVLQRPAAGTVASLGLNRITLIALDAAGNRQEQVFDLRSSSRVDQGGVLSSSQVGTGVDASLLGAPAGSVFTRMGVPALNHDGAVAFQASYKQGAAVSTGLFVGDPPQLLVASGQAAPGLVNAKFTSFFDPCINLCEDREPSIAFLAKVSTGQTGLWTNVTGDLQLVAIQGGTAPGADAATFKSFTSFSVVEDEILFTAVLGGSVHSGNDIGAWCWSADSGLTLLIREGQSLQVAGHEQQVVSRFDLLNSVACSPGHGRHQPIAGLHFARIFCTDGSQLLCASGEQQGEWSAVAWSQMETLPGIKPLDLGTPAGNSLGQMVFLQGFALKAGSVSSLNNAGIVLHGARGWELAVRKGDAVPGLAGATWSSFADPVINEDGAVAWTGNIKSSSLLAGVGSRDAAGKVRLVARKGGDAPGTSGAVFAVFKSFALPSGMGVVFTASLQLKPGLVTAGDDTGVWAVDSQGELRLLIREGQSFAGKKVSTFSLLGSVVGSMGQTRSFNNQRTLVSLVQFTDGSQILLRSQVP